MNQHTGNWPGKTVENTSGICYYRENYFLLMDIPGTYSIMSHSEEEEIARDYICFGNPDATVVIVDATCLERNLNLVYQIMEITPKIIVCVNLLDEAKKKGIHIDLKQLEKELGVPVVGTVARKKKTLKQLMETIRQVCIGEKKPKPYQVKYVPILEDSIAMLSSRLQHMLPKEKQYLLRWLALKIIDGEPKILSSIKRNLQIKNSEELEKKKVQVEEMLKKQDFYPEDRRDKIIASIVLTAEKVTNKVVSYEKQAYQKKDRKIDKILTSKKFGIPIMIAFLAFILWLTFHGLFISLL